MRVVQREIVKLRWGSESELLLSRAAASSLSTFTLSSRNRDSRPPWAPSLQRPRALLQAALADEWGRSSLLLGNVPQRSSRLASAPAARPGTLCSAETLHRCAERGRRGKRNTARRKSPACSPLRSIREKLTTRETWLIRRGGVPGLCRAWAI